MSTLYVIRHGQASFGSEDYDVLSETGREQSRRLGAWLKERRLDAVFSGPRVRHRETAALMCEAHGEAPHIVELAGLDEYPAELILRQAVPEVFENPPSTVEFQALFEEVMHGWVSGDRHYPELESFAAFTARVTEALGGIMSGAGRGREVAVVTSAGPVSVALQMTLGITGAMVLRQSWVVANTAITEIRFREDQVTLLSFNETPHLPDRRLITYR